MHELKSLLILQRGIFLSVEYYRGYEKLYYTLSQYENSLTCYRIITSKNTVLTQYWNNFVYYPNLISPHFYISFIDIDECSLAIDNCPRNLSCTNTDGSFLCSCDSGYSWNGTVCKSKKILQFGTYI